MSCGDTARSLTLLEGVDRGHRMVSGFDPRCVCAKLPGRILTSGKGFFIVRKKNTHSIAFNPFCPFLYRIVLTTTLVLWSRGGKKKLKIVEQHMVEQHVMEHHVVKMEEEEERSMSDPALPYLGKGPGLDPTESSNENSASDP